MQEGPLYRFGQVDYQSAGPLSVRRSLIEREFDMQPGDIYRRSQVQRTIDHLYSTNLFRSIQATPLAGFGERAAWRSTCASRSACGTGSTPAIGSGTAERLSFIASWGKRNLWERGYSGSLASRLSLDDHARFLLWRTEASLLSAVGVRPPHARTGDAVLRSRAPTG